MKIVKFLCLLLLYCVDVKVVKLKGRLGNWKFKFHYNRICLQLKRRVKISIKNCAE